MNNVDDVQRDLQAVGLDEEKFPVFKNAFEPQVRRALVYEDLEAGNGVTGVLVFIVSVGLVLMVSSVIIMQFIS